MNPPVKKELHHLFDWLAIPISVEFLFMPIYLPHIYEDITDLNYKENVMWY